MTRPLAPVAEANARSTVSGVAAGGLRSAPKPGLDLLEFGPGENGGAKAAGGNEAALELAAWA